MRERKWVLVLAGLLTLVIAGTYLVWRMSKANEHIKQLIISELHEIMDTESTVGAMDIGINHVRLSNVVLASKENAFKIVIDEVRLGYNLWNLFKYRLKPHRVPHEVILINPNIIFQKLNIWDSAGNGIADDVDPQIIVKETGHIKRLMVSNAEISISDSSGKTVRLIHSLNGWINTVPVDSSQIRLSGSILNSSSKNVVISGAMDIVKLRPIYYNIRIEPFNPPPDLPLLLPQYVSIAKGELFGELRYNRFDGHSGYININDGIFSIKESNLFFEQVNLQCVLANDSVAVTADINRFNGSRLQMDGHLFSLTRPQLDINIFSDALDLESFLGYSAPETKLSLKGGLKTHFKITGDPLNPVIDGRLSSADLSWYGIVINHFNADIHFYDNILSVQGIGKQGSDLMLEMTGSMDFRDSLQKTELSILLDGDVYAAYSDADHRMIQSLPVYLVFDIEGPIRDLSGQAEGSITFNTASNHSFPFQTSVDYAKKQLHFTGGYGQNLSIEGNVQQPFGQDIQWDIAASGLETVLMPVLGLSGNIWSRMKIQAASEGVSKEWSFSGTGLAGQNEEVSWKSRWFINDDSFLSLNLDGVYKAESGETIQFTLNGEKARESDFLIKNITIEDLIGFSGSYPVYGKAYPDGMLDIKRFDIALLNNIWPSFPAFSGIVSGRMRWSDIENTTQFRSHFALQEGRFYTDNLYEGEWTLLGENGKFNRLSINFRQNDIPILAGEAYLADNDLLKGSFGSKNIDFGAAVSGLVNRSFMQGSGQYSISIAGNTVNPVLSARCIIEDGKAGPVRFQKGEFTLSDTLNMQKIEQGSIYIQDAELTLDRETRVFAEGRFDRGADGESDITVSGQGNIIQVLSDISSFIKTGSGRGEFVTRWIQTEDEWALGSGRLEIEEGAMTCAAVFDKIDNLNFSAELEPETRYVQIRNGRALIQGDTLYFANSRESQSSFDIADLEIPFFGLNMGALYLRTGEKGVRLNIPGLMEPGDRGRLAFYGYTPSEMFTIAGPVENPLLRGQILCSNSRLTYPFISSQANGDEEELGFVNDLFLDLHIVPVEEVYYVKSFPNVLGNVRLNLKLRNNIGGIFLKGISNKEGIDVWGNLESTEGVIELPGHYFRSEYISFEYPRGSGTPFISGRAFTTVIDSLGTPATIWLDLTSTDSETGLEQSGGPWGKVRFQFSTNNPNIGVSQADIMAALGYSAAHAGERAYGALGYQMESRIFRPILRPIEKGLRRYLGLDMVHVSSMFSRNLAQFSIGNEYGWDPRFLFRSTKVTLGKYITSGLFMTYSGQIHDGLNYELPMPSLGYRHSLIFEYTIRPDLFFEFEYSYDTQLLSNWREDKRIWLRHIFPF